MSSRSQWGILSQQSRWIALKKEQHPRPYGHAHTHEHTYIAIIHPWHLSHRKARITLSEWTWQLLEIYYLSFAWPHAISTCDWTLVLRILCSWVSIDLRHAYLSEPLPRWLSGSCSTFGLILVTVPKRGSQWAGCATKLLMDLANAATQTRLALFRLLPSVLSTTGLYSFLHITPPTHTHHKTKGKPPK